MTTSGTRGFTLDVNGQAWLNFMNGNMGQWMRNAIVLHNPNGEIVVPILENIFEIASIDLSSEKIIANYSIRSEPSESSRPSGRLDEASSANIMILGKYEPTIAISENSSHWILISYNHQIGWVASNALDINVDIIPNIQHHIIDPNLLNPDINSAIILGVSS